MKNNYSFYYEKNNVLFDSDAIAVCYKASKKEMEKYGLTSENIVILIKSKNITKNIDKKDCDFFDIIKNSFKKEIFLRIQSECLLGVYGDSHCDCESQKKYFFDLLKDNDGIYIHMPQEAQGWGLFYKLKELELQVNGRNPEGKYIGVMTRDEAQKYIAGTNGFEDKRSYELIYNILSDFDLVKKKYIVYTDSDKKINEMNKAGLDAIKYSKYIEHRIDSENISEYLVKILNQTHDYSKEIIDGIYNVIVERQYNERSLETLIDIVKNIKDNEDFKINRYAKNKLLKAYNEIICGEEKDYILKYSSLVKRQNKFTCLVNPMIFRQLYKIYGHNVFGRICFEEMYLFLNVQNGDSKKIRSSKVLDTTNDDSSFFIDQVYVVERTIKNNSKTVVEDTTSKSKLSSLFENPEYEYIRKHEMITYISEGQLDGINIYLKRIPNQENYVLDIYGKRDKINQFITALSNQKQLAILNFVTDMKLEKEEYSKYNLHFSNVDLAIKDELDNYKQLKECDKNGNRS